MPNELSYCCFYLPQDGIVFWSLNYALCGHVSTTWKAIFFQNWSSTIHSLIKRSIVGDYFTFVFAVFQRQHFLNKGYCVNKPLDNESSPRSRNLIKFLAMFGTKIRKVTWNVIWSMWWRFQILLQLCRR